MNTTQKRKLAMQIAFVAVLLVLLLAEPVFASTSTSTGGSNIFGALIEMLVGWLKGGLGMLLAIIALIAGIVAGVAKGSLGGALGCVGIAIACYWGPDILQGIFGATVHTVAFATISHF